MLVNPRASRSGSELAPALKRLREAGAEVVQEPVDDPAGIPERARAARGFDAIILGGGDGTLSSAAESLVEVGVPLGILPLGTANDLARTLGVPLDVEGACEVVARRRTRWIDLGRVNGRYFFNVASLGVSTQLTEVLDDGDKRRLGVLSYAWSALGAASTSRPFRATIRCDGRRERVRALQIDVANGRHRGGGLVVDAEATLDDGSLSVCVMQGRSVWQLAGVLPRMLRGDTWKSRRVKLRRCRRVEVHTSRPLQIDADGELGPWTPAEFEVVPRAMQIFADEARA